MTSSVARAAARPLLAARGAARVRMAAAAAMLALGFLLVFWHNDSLGVTADLLGIALVVTGMLRLAQGATAGGEAAPHRSAHLLIGLLALLAGIYCMGHMAAAAVPLSLVAGLFWAMHGLVDLVAASYPGPGRVLTGIAGGLGLLAGLVAIFWPAITVQVLAAVLGTWLACDGALLAVTTLYLRHVAVQAAARQPPDHSRPSRRPRATASRRDRTPSFR